MNSRLSQSRGVSLISVIIAMLLLALLGSVMVSMVTNERFVGANQAQAVSAQYLAEAGLDRALHYFFDENQGCETDNTVFYAALGNGHYTVSTTQYAPTALTLTATITESDDQFVVSGDAIAAGYAPYGIVVIDSEDIECAQVAGNTFSSCKRGVGGTTPAIHDIAGGPKKVYQEFCIVNSIGTTSAALAGTVQRVVSIGFSQFDLGWAVGDQGTILQWNGLEWSAVPSPTQRKLNAVKLTAFDRGWIAGDLGVMGQLSGGAPWTKQRSASMYLAANNGADIAVFDTDPHEVGQPARVQYIPVAGGGAREVATTPNGKYLYVTRGSPKNDVVVIDPAACLASPATCTNLKTTLVGADPHGLAVSTDGTRVYVVNEGANPGTVSIIHRVSDTDPTQDVVESLVTLESNYTPHYIGLIRDGSKAFVTTSTAQPTGRVEVITGLLPPDTPAVLAGGISIADSDLWGIAIHPTDPSAYVAGRATGQVFSIDTQNNLGGAVIPAGGTPWQISYTNDSKAYVSKNDVHKVLALSTISNQKITDVDVVDNGPAGLATSADNTEIYVANVANGRVNIVHVQDNSLGTAGTVTGLVGGITAAPDPSFRSISMISPSEGWAVGGDGRILKWDGTTWGAQPLATMPTATLPPNTQPAGQGMWETIIEPEQDAYVKMNDDDPACTNGCSYNYYGTDDPDRLGLRRYEENSANPSDVSDPNNQRIYRPFLKFDLGTVKQYALKVSTANLNLYATNAEPVPLGTTTVAGSGLVLRYRFEDCVGFNDINNPDLCTDPTPQTISSPTSPPNIATFCGNGGLTCTGQARYHLPTTPLEPSVEGRALKFDGVDDRAAIFTPSTTLAIKPSITVEAWVFFTDAAQLDASRNQELIRKGLTSSELAYMLWIQGGKPAFTVRASGIRTDAVSADPLPALQTNRWYHLAGTYDGANVKIYQDGVFKGQTAASGQIFTHPGPPPANSNYCKGYSGIRADSLCIGGDQTNSFQGWLDEVRIYNQALTTEQVAEDAGWGERLVEVYNVAGPWSPANLSGGSQPVGGLGGFGQNISSLKVTTEHLPRWLSWNVTGLVQGWVFDTYPNYGLGLRVGLKPAEGSEPAETDPGPNGILWLYSSDVALPMPALCTDSDHNCRPYLDVTYVISRRPNLESVAVLDTDNDGHADTGWAVGAAGVIFLYNQNNSGAWSLWQQSDNGGVAGPPLPTQGLKSISMRSSTEGWAVGDGGTIYHFTGTITGGAVAGTWQADPQSGVVTPNDLTAVSISAKNRGLAVGKRGTLLVYDGNNWLDDSSAAVPSDFNLTAIKAFSNATGWGTGEQGKIIRKFGGNWVDQGYAGTVPGVGNTNLEGIDMLQQQTTVTDWRESY